MTDMSGLIFKRRDIIPIYGIAKDLYENRKAYSSRLCDLTEKESAIIADKLFITSIYNIAVIKGIYEVAKLFG